MKKIIFTISIVCILISNIFAQVPQAINFQAIARDASGNIMASTNIMIRLSVVDSVTGGTIVYQELRALQTDQYGSFNFQIGLNPNFVTTGVFNNINWATGRKFLKIDYDPTNTFNWALTLGTIGFSTVPYSFAAASVTNITTTGANNGDVLKYNSTSGKWEPATMAASSSIPVGTVVPFAGTVVPAGWLLCNGGAISRTTYADLFAVIGNSWGAGDYTTTFNLPDMRGVFLRGVDGSAGNDPDASTRTALHPGGNTGNNIGSFQLDGLKSHNHTGTTNTDAGHSHTATSSSSGNHNHTFSVSNGGSSGGSSYLRSTSGEFGYSTSTDFTFSSSVASGGAHSHSISIDSGGSHLHSFTSNSTGGNETRTKNVYVNYIIKY